MSISGIPQYNLAAAEYLRDVFPNVDFKAHCA